MTERLDLERRYDALIRVQGETLDNLTEAVAVFGSDGRMRLHNPVFARMWRLDAEMLARRPHIETVSTACRPLHGDHPIWQRLRAMITAIEDREPVIGRIERRDGNVVDCATMPLPDGATLLTFQDVTDTVNVERALRERNEALEAADRLKIDFVHHVSYELRSPLTNIIGFAYFLGDPLTGPLTDKQREYLELHHSIHQCAARHHQQHPGSCEHRCRRDDAGARGGRYPRGHAGRRRSGAAAPRRERGDAGDEGGASIGRFEADGKRVRQVLFNLLSNAMGFSQHGGPCSPRPSARRRDRLPRQDRGKGIPQAEIKDRVFDRFESHAGGTGHRGIGLGLSLVRSFVELHGGSVTLESTLGRGTTVTCIFPLDHRAERSAA